MYGYDNLLFETVKKILIEGSTQKGGWTGWGWHYQAVAVHIHQQCCIRTVFNYWLLPNTLLAPFVMCFVCVNVILSVPPSLNGNIFKMRNIWGFLIGQFLLPTYVAFFHSKNQWKKKKSYLYRHAYCSTECCTNCHCPSVRSKTALLFPGLITPLQRIHVQYAALYLWIQSVRCIHVGVNTSVNLYFCGNICFFPSM